MLTYWNVCIPCIPNNIVFYIKSIADHQFGQVREYNVRLGQILECIIRLGQILEYNIRLGQVQGLSLIQI